MTQKLSIIADVGGTNTRVALAQNETLVPRSIAKYQNASHDSLQALLRQYMREQDQEVCEGAAVAIAGPVRDGKGGLTNLKWEIDEDDLAQLTGASRSLVINDLQAQGHALGHIPENLLKPIKAGLSAPDNATKLVIGVGTGFNATLVLQSGETRIVAPSEVGQTTLPVLSDQDLRLAQFLNTNFGAASIEEALSGRGLEQIYAWIGHEQGSLSQTTTYEIFKACADNSDEAAVLAVATMVRLMGTVFGDLALVHLPFGGIYLIGGIARASSTFFDAFDFKQHFTKKGSFSGLMGEFPVSVIDDDFAALKGLSLYLTKL